MMRNLGLLHDPLDYSMLPDNTITSNNNNYIVMSSSFYNQFLM